MHQYLSLLEDVLASGSYEERRTDANTIATMSDLRSYPLGESYPLVTTKKMDTFRWNSMLHELIWYLSGEHHVRTLREKTGIWDAWADENGVLPSAYGRFWRRFPVPEADAQLEGETWVSPDHPRVTRDAETGTLVFDQVGHILDALAGESEHRGRNSRRLKLSAWHPANANVSSLPPCHTDVLFNVQHGRLYCQLNQRSADLALGVPFNIACYALLTKLLAREAGDLSLGTFDHVLGDAHIYCGKGERSRWYAEHLDDLQARVRAVDERAEFRDVRDWVLEEAPPETEAETNPDAHQYGYDHVPGVLEQLAREPYDPPRIRIGADSVDSLAFDDISLVDYESYEGIGFSVAV